MFLAENGEHLRTEQTGKKENCHGFKKMKPLKYTKLG